MDKEFLHFEKINRETWQNLHRKTTPPLSQTELNSIKSFNDRINLQDVRDVYLPLTNLIGIYKRSKPAVFYRFCFRGPSKARAWSW